MASLDNMASFETWEFRPTFDNSWISETFTKETDALLTEAFAKSLTNESNTENVSLSVSDTRSSEPENVSIPVSKRPAQNAATKKITKRKTRPSKRSTTTFITADPANFREMVQQVTGVRFESGPSQIILKPEQQQYRVGFGSGHVGCLLPTLDTSAFLLDHRQQVVGPSKISSGPSVGPNGGPGFDFDGFSCFPTLESWKVM